MVHRTTVAPSESSVTPAKILPCPFCGSLPAINKRQAGAGYWMVECLNSDCNVIVEAGELDRDAALQAWNRRSTPMLGRAMATGAP
jgi:Lar family restriction alleviation protein